MNNPLPPLGLDDIRAAGPDRDNAEAFDPAETWANACDKIAAGYPAATVAALLLEMHEDELQEVLNEWQERCISGEERDAESPDVLLCQAIDQSGALGKEWPLPPIDAATVLPLLTERDELREAADMWRAEAARQEQVINGLQNVTERSERLRAALGDVLALAGDDDGATVAVAIPHDLLARVRGALGLS